jgi:hypothetical protein
MNRERPPPSKILLNTKKQLNLYSIKTKNRKMKKSIFAIMLVGLIGLMCNVTRAACPTPDVGYSVPKTKKVTPVVAKVNIVESAYLTIEKGSFYRCVSNSYVYDKVFLKPVSSLKVVKPSLELFLKHRQPHKITTKKAIKNIQVLPSNWRTC